MSPVTEVLLCAFNGAPFVVAQLESILNQTRPVDRISIHDDASTDDTIERIRDWSSRVPAGGPIVDIHVHARNLGYRENFARAIAQATGDVLFLSDQDDVWEPRKVEVLLRVLAAERADMVFSDALLIDDAGLRIGVGSVLGSYGLSSKAIRRFGDRAFARLIRRNYINGAAAAVRREAAQSALPLPAEIPHDYWLAIWCAARGRIAATEECLYRYRQHGGNLIGVGPSRALYTWLGIWRHPDWPRERELAIWQAVAQRLATTSCEAATEAARGKAEWLARVVASGQGTRARAGAIARSILDGSYRAYSDTAGLTRDVVSLLRSRQAPP